MIGDPASEFDHGIAVVPRPDEPCTFDGELGAGWQIGSGVNGGLLLAMLGNALRSGFAESGQTDPLSVSGYYLSASRPGPATLRTETDGHHAVPAGVRVYELAGPLFFGAAKTAMEALHTAGGKDHTVILAMMHVPTIDATGLVAVESTLDRLYRSKIKVILAGVTTDVAEIFERAGIKREPGRLAYAPDVETAIAMAVVQAAPELQAA